LRHDLDGHKVADHAHRVACHEAQKGVAQLNKLVRRECKRTDEKGFYRVLKLVGVIDCKLAHHQVALPSFNQLQMKHVDANKRHDSLYFLQVRCPQLAEIARGVYKLVKDKQGKQALENSAEVRMNSNGLSLVLESANDFVQKLFLLVKFFFFVDGGDLKQFGTFVLVLDTSQSRRSLLWLPELVKKGKDLVSFRKVFFFPVLAPEDIEVF
jgi:hypothetical protein